METVWKVSVRLMDILWKTRSLGIYFHKKHFPSLSLMVILLLKPTVSFQNSFYNLLWAYDTVNLSVLEPLGTYDFSATTLWPHYSFHLNLLCWAFLLFQTLGLFLSRSLVRCKPCSLLESQWDLLCWGEIVGKTNASCVLKGSHGLT